MHGVLGHDPRIVAEQVQALGLPVDYWVHDYIAACSGYTLMRNNVEWCGGPPVESSSCRLCVHGARRREHVEAMQALLDLPALAVCAPSEAAAREWLAATKVGPAGRGRPPR